jgi:hypothetical protein
MTINISNLTISNDTTAGGLIGVLTTSDASGTKIQCDYSLTTGSVGYFAVSDNKLVTAWTKPPMPGYYSVCVYAVGTAARFNGSAWFTVTVAVPVPSITVNGSDNATVAPGAVLSISVTSGPGNTTDWVGLAAAGAPDTSIIDWVYLNGARTPPVMGTTSATVTMTAPATNGSYEARLYVNNGWTVLDRSTLTVQNIVIPEPIITVTPITPQISDITPRGAVVAAYSVTMSDGSPFTGTVRFGAPYYDAGGIFALSGSNIIVNPTGPGVGPNTSTVTDHITLEALP